MNRIAANLSVAALLASALIAAGCSTSEPLDTEEDTAENAAAVEDDGAVEIGDEGSPVALAADAPEAAPEPLAAPEPTECAGTWSYLPAGTDTWENPDGSLGYALPPGFVSIEEDPGTGALYAATGGTITCSCTKGSGDCSPVSAGGKSGCFMGSGCSSCDKSGAAKIIDVAAGVSFAALEDVTGLPPVTPGLLDLPIVADAFQQFKAVVAADAGLQDAAELDGPKGGMAVDDHTFVAAPGWTLAAVNVFGRIALVSVPEGYGKMMAAAWGSKQTCTCTAGSGCTAGSMLGAKYCEAGGCTSCSMSLSAAALGALVSLDKTPACSE